MQNKNKVVLPEVGVSWRTTPNTKRSLNFLIFTTFSMVFQSYRKIKTKTAVFSRFFCFFLDLHWFFKHTEKSKQQAFFHKFSSSWNCTCFFKPKIKTKEAVVSRFFFLTFFLGILHWSFTHINNQNTVDNFCIILANCEAYTLQTTGLKNSAMLFVYCAHSLKSVFSLPSYVFTNFFQQQCSAVVNTNKIYYIQLKAVGMQERLKSVSKFRHQLISNCTVSQQSFIDQKFRFVPQNT